ncbi:MAG: hypothetical protein CL676_06610 [Bdellovibrionaceae bacterium]|nr:hypothetical protein [Pseudobdellovibrionaceae bacterium]
MRNWKKDYKILALVLILAVGFIFEGLRRMPVNTEGLEDQELSKAARIFSIYRESAKPLQKQKLAQAKPAALPKVRAPRGMKFDLKAAISNYQKEYGLEEHESGAVKRPEKLKKSEKAKKKTKNSKYEYVYDYNRGRWVKRRKLTDDQLEEYMARKEERAYQKQLEEARQAQLKKQMKDRKTSSTDSTSASGDVILLGEAPPKGIKKETEDQKNQRSFEEWARVLLQFPSKTELQKFINAHESGEVSKATLDRMIQAFLDDPRVEMKDQGLTLIDLYPSVSSFKMLVAFLDLDRTTGVWERADRILKADYGTMKGTNILSQVMTNVKEENVLVAATVLLKSAVNQAKTAIESSSEPTTLSVNYASVFSPFIQLLTNLTQMGGNVASEANKTLAHLEQRLNVHTVASNDGI